MIALVNLAQIVLIDLSLAGDNALVVGMAIAALPQVQRRKAMLAGIGVATVMRVVMALFAVSLLHLTGLLLAGGLLLAWVAWKMARELIGKSGGDSQAVTVSEHATLMRAIWRIVIADVSMSLENTLAIAGVARTDQTTLVIGLGLSVLLMALVSTQIARLAARYPKIAYIGVAIVAYVAMRMIYDGVLALAPQLAD